MGLEAFKSCTPFGIMRLLKNFQIDCSGKLALVIGRSQILGKPMSALLLNADATVITAHSKTKNLEKLICDAEIVVAAVGIPKFINCKMLKKGSVLVDAGYHPSEKCGDVDMEGIKDIVSAYTPVPGGVGPMTINTLILNTVNAMEKTVVSNKPIPCLVGFGGITPAGRASHNLSYSRMTYDFQSDEEKTNYLKSVLSLCGLIDETLDSSEINQFVKSKEEDVLNNTLMRQLDYKFFRETFWTYDYDMPANACAQLPFQLDPVKHYASRQHPKALGMSILGIADAISDTGLDLKKNIDTYGRDKVGCFAGCAVMNMDRYSGDGLFASHPLGQRATSKHISFTLPEMTADFINAYVTGSLGITGHFIGACATSLYNLNAGVELIKSGKVSWLLLVLQRLS